MFIGHFAVGLAAKRVAPRFLALVYLGNLLGPPPPGEKAIAVAGLAQWLLIPWAWWTDRHRKTIA